MFTVPSNICEYIQSPQKAFSMAQCKIFQTVDLQTVETDTI